MTQQARAVICREIGKPVVVETVSVDAPQRGEVMIKLAACGVCHSDLSATNGTIPFPPPVVLGHEGAGEIIAIGEGVTGFALGDHVVSSFVSMCGLDSTGGCNRLAESFCTRFPVEPKGRRLPVREADYPADRVRYGNARRVCA